MDDQTDGPTNAVDDEPEPDFKELARGALENSDIRPGKHTPDQPVKGPVESREVVISKSICRTTSH